MMHQLMADIRQIFEPFGDTFTEEEGASKNRAARQNVNARSKSLRCLCACLGSIHTAISTSLVITDGIMGDHRAQSTDTKTANRSATNSTRVDLLAFTAEVFDLFTTELPSPFLNNTCMEEISPLVQLITVQLRRSGGGSSLDEIKLESASQMQTPKCLLLEENSSGTIRLISLLDFCSSLLLWRSLDRFALRCYSTIMDLISHDISIELLLTDSETLLFKLWSPTGGPTKLYRLLRTCPVAERREIQGTLQELLRLLLQNESLEIVRASIHKSFEMISMLVQDVCQLSENQGHGEVLRRELLAMQVNAVLEAHESSCTSRRWQSMDVIAEIFAAMGAESFLGPRNVLHQVFTGTPASSVVLHLSLYSFLKGGIVYTFRVFICGRSFGESFAKYSLHLLASDENHTRQPRYRTPTMGSF